MMGSTGISSDKGVDLEQGNGDFLMNTSVKSFSWSGLNVTVKDRQSKEPRDLIHDISGDVRQGNLFELGLSWCSC